MSKFAGEHTLAIASGPGCLVAKFHAMGGPCEVLADSDDIDLMRRIASIVAGEAWRIEEKFSRYRTDTIVHAINTAGGRAVEVDSETAGLLDFAARMFELSDGAFDITSGALRRVWRFDGSGRVPTRAAVRAVHADVGWPRAGWHRPWLRLPPGMEIDLGGIGKEYAVDRAALLVSQTPGVNVLINFGGDIVATGPRTGREPWRVGVEAAGDRRGVETLVRLASGGLATSGDSRRYLLRNGVRYGHILDARTGWPVPGSPCSVTVAADTCTEAGMLATLAMLKGRDAEDFLRAQGRRFWCQRRNDRPAHSEQERRPIASVGIHT
jgi:thiamine biosynthesis lipoprotein